MKSRLALTFGSVALLVVTAVYAVREEGVHRQKRASLERLRQATQQWHGLAEANATLRPDGRQLRLMQARIADLTQELNQAALALRNLRRKHGEKPDPVWPAGSSVLLSAQWQNVGAATPAAAMESFLCAARNGDIGQISSLIGLQPYTKRLADAAFALLPAATQLEYGTPEKMIATYVAAQIPDYSAMAKVQTDASTGSVAVQQYRMEDAGGDQRDFTFLFQKSAEGAWKLAVPLWTVAHYIDDLQGRVAAK